MHIIKRKDGGVSIMSNVEDVLAEIAKWPQELQDQVVSVREAAEGESLPSDRLFRDAWSDEGVAVKPDLEKSKAIHMARVRFMRDKALDALDKDEIKHMSMNNQPELAKVRAKKQQLRDAPSQLGIESVTKTDSLRDKWPVGLELHPDYQ